MPEKARSDSVHQQTIEAQREDTSTTPLPTIAGMDLLNEIGRDFFAAV